MTTILVATNSLVNARWVTDHALQQAHQVSVRLVADHADRCLPTATSSADGRAITHEGRYQQQARLRPYPIPNPVVSVTGSIGLPIAVWYGLQTLVLGVDLSQPIDLAGFNAVRQFARLLQASLDIICLDDDPDESPQKAAWRIRDLFRYQPFGFHYFPGNDMALAFTDYFTKHLPTKATRLSGPAPSQPEIVGQATVPVAAARWHSSSTIHYSTHEKDSAAN